MSRRVVILSSRSLFAEGIAMRLRQHLGQQEIKTVDARQSDPLNRVMALQPSTVILDATDHEVKQLCPLGNLLNALPALTVIRLDPQREEVQIVTSQKRSAGTVNDLIELIRD